MNFEFLRKTSGKRNPSLSFLVKGAVGKTSLVKEFARVVPHVYFLADKDAGKGPIAVTSERVGLLYNDEFLLSRGFGAWHEFFRYLKGKGRVVIIDEFPFLVERTGQSPPYFRRAGINC